METLTARSMRMNFLFQSLALRVKGKKSAEQADAEAPPGGDEPPLTEGTEREEMEVGEVESEVADAAPSAPHTSEPLRETFEMSYLDLEKTVAPLSTEDRSN